MSGIRRALWACAVMMVVTLHTPPAQKWQVWTPRGGGDVCGAGKPVWDRETCEVRLQTPRLTKGTLSGGGQLPGPITDLLNLLLGTLIKDLTVYKANTLACSLVKEIRVTADRLEIHLQGRHRHDGSIPRPQMGLQLTAGRTE